MSPRATACTTLPTEPRNARRFSRKMSRGQAPFSRRRERGMKLFGNGQWQEGSMIGSGKEL